jgi:ribosomal protein S18 acetylase RimI-like enzyme
VQPETTRLNTHVRLDPMTADEYTAYIEYAVQGYASEKVKSGEWAAEGAERRSRATFDNLLPEGPDTVGSHLFTVRDAETPSDGESVGIVYVALREKAGHQGTREIYIYDIEMREQARGRGYGRATMTACADFARKKGAASVGLHVFGHNTTARSLYRSLGFVETNVIMSLDVTGDAGTDL